MVNKEFVRHVEYKGGKLVFYSYMDGTTRLGGHCELKKGRGLAFYTSRGNPLIEAAHGPIVATWIVSKKTKETQK